MHVLREQYVWTRETVFVSCDTRSAFIYTFSKLISEMISIGKQIYCGADRKIEWLPNHQWSPEMILESEASAIQGTEAKLKKFEMELLYYSSNYEFKARKLSLSFWLKQNGSETGV